MIHIDSLILEEFYNENKDFFENAKVQKIQQPTRKEIILQLRKNAQTGGETKKFYININPEYHHVCFMSKDNEKRRCLEIPKQPPMFCMLLRKHMEGAKILKINKPNKSAFLKSKMLSIKKKGESIPLYISAVTINRRLKNNIRKCSILSIIKKPII